MVGTYLIVLSVYLQDIFEAHASISKINCNSLITDTFKIE